MRSRTLYLAVIQPNLAGYVRGFSFRWDTPLQTMIQMAVSKLPDGHRFIFNSFEHQHAQDALRAYEAK